MKGKIKGLIIGIVAFVLVGVAALVGVTVFGNITSVTIGDLRVIDATTEEELFERDVYLTALEENKFDIKILYTSTSAVDYAVVSSDPTIANVTKSKDVYTVSYYKVGQVTITATPAEGSDISDSFVLNVKENVPTSFKINDQEAVSETEVNIYADDKDYVFDFEARKGSIVSDINLSNITILDNYNKDVFESISIDDINSTLVIKAKQNKDK